MDLMLKEVLGMIDINILIFLVSILALYYAWQSRVLAQQAFSLSLFNNRYKFYHEFRALIEELALISGFPTEQHLSKLKFLYWESKYIFGEEIGMLMESLFRNVDVICRLQNFRDDNEGRELGEASQTIDRLINELSGKQDGPTLDSYFQGYLCNKAFRKKI
jgi:hypothetical protein